MKNRLPGSGARRSALVAFFCGTTALIAVAPVWAQTTPLAKDGSGEPSTKADSSAKADSAGLSVEGEGDIVVTARKREETLINVPVAVSALMRNRPIRPSRPNPLFTVPAGHPASLGGHER